MKKIKILGEDIPVGDDYKDIDTLKFLKDNPRVYACTHGMPDFEHLTDEEQQEEIFKRLQKEVSVQKLIPEIRRHGGLMEPILIRHDTMEVIEGNSRLAVYRLLRKNRYDGEWQFIPCDIVSSLSDEQQAAFLNQIHIKGKTKWSAYEKANFTFVRKDRGWNFDRIATLFGESHGTIRTRYRVIKMMRDNGDSDQDHFSYYDVMVRNPEISKEMNDERLSDILLDRIKNLESRQDDFTAQDLRKKLPVILKRVKIRKKYLAGDVDLDGAYQRARISDVEEKIKQARSFLADVSLQEVKRLERGELGAFKQAVRKLTSDVERIARMIGTLNSR